MNNTAFIKNEIFDDDSEQKWLEFSIKSLRIIEACNVKKEQDIARSYRFYVNHQNFLLFLIEILTKLKHNMDAREQRILNTQAFLCGHSFKCKVVFAVNETVEKY